VKNAGEYAKSLSQLLRQLRKHASPRDEPQREPLDQLIYAFLVWEASHNQADQAYPRLFRECVDLNDLRVTDPDDLADIIGHKHSKAGERAHRLCRTLHAVYRREHAMDLAPLKDMAKRDARAYLEQLEGITPFVTASVLLHALGGHAIPVDPQLRDRLAADHVIDPDATVEDAQGFLENNIRSDDAIEAYYLLRAYVERPIKVNIKPPAARTAKKTKKTTKTKKKTTKRKPKKAPRKKK